MNPIQDVLATFDRWDGSLERAYIRSQQKPAPPLPVPVAPKPRYDGQQKANGKTAKVRAVMQGGNWWTVTELSDRAGITVHLVFGVLSALKRQGEVEAERPFRKRGAQHACARWMAPQRYRMVTR